MYTTTNKPYLYYKLNNTYFKVPTYGKLFKIIDFGRAIFTFKNKIYMNDVFEKNGEAGGQYTYPNQISFFQEKEQKIIKPNYHFDLCRLSMTILEEINLDKLSDNLHNLLKYMCSDKDNQSFCDLHDNFDLYISISQFACHALPRFILEHDLFKQYRIKKKYFPLKSYYSL